MSQHWSYDGESGPTEWSKLFSLEAFKHQSPIDINTSTIVYNENLSKNPLLINYDSLNVDSVTNNGHTFQLSSGDSNESIVSGGPVENSYKFAQFHAHWGDEDNGSEHTVDGIQYAAEIHFVNWNSEKYSTSADAAKSSSHDGLLVLGVFVKVGEENVELKKIINSFDKIECNGQSTKLTDRLNIKGLFPTDLTSYWTYDGSLTTPPCYESVKWVVFKDPIEISIDQLNAIKKVYRCCYNNESCEDYRIKHNFRPTCPLNDRVVYKSFQ